MEKTCQTPRIPYLTPKLEQHQQWTQVIGVILGIGGNGIPNPLELENLGLEGQ
jgi:hypothetical protein